jgi:hypothetical protein
MSLNAFADASNSGARPIDDLGSCQGEIYGQHPTVTPNPPMTFQEAYNNPDGRLFPTFPDPNAKPVVKSGAIVSPSPIFCQDDSPTQHQSSNASNGTRNLLMCCQARVQYTNQLPILAQVFLDSGSQRNLISTDFAARIGSRPVRYEHVIMAGFDAIPQPRRAPVHVLTLHGFYGQTFKLELFELEKIVGGITYISNPYHSAINEALLPAHMLSHSPPDVLIGVKDYLRLSVIPQDALPSGFTRLHSHLGDIIAGEGRISSQRFGQQSNQVTSPMITVIEEVDGTIIPTWLTCQGHQTSKSELPLGHDLIMSASCKTFQGHKTQHESRVDQHPDDEQQLMMRYHQIVAINERYHHPPVPDKIARQCFWVAQGRKAIIRNLAIRCNSRFKGTPKPNSVRNEPSFPPSSSNVMRVCQNSDLNYLGPMMVNENQRLQLQRKPPDRLHGNDDFEKID